MQSFLDRMDARGFLAILLLGGVMALAFLLAVKAPDSDTFKILLGGLMTTGFAGVIQWYYGSSSGSAMKDEAMAKTAASQTETIAKQAVATAALAATAPAATVTTVTNDPGPPPTTTVKTEPAPEGPPAPSAKPAARP